MNGLLYAVGGVPTPGQTSTFLNRLEVYNPATNAWAVRAEMPTARSETGVGVLNNMLYVLGGYASLGVNTYGFVATNEAYHPKTARYISAWEHESR